nr:MAG TPA: hypothetical protein [Caudoviricetes sp.]
MAKTLAGQIIEGRTEHIREVGSLSVDSLKWGNLGKAIDTVRNAITEPVLVALSDKWIAISAFNPASTENGYGKTTDTTAWSSRLRGGQTSAKTPDIDRFDYNKLWSVQLEDYFLPLSQTFTLKAKKKLKTSTLVDGPDVIQQTRKQAKTISCSMRISLREEQSNLQIVDAQNKIIELASFLQAFYETDAVIEIKNRMINETFGVNYVILSDYEFAPRAGMNTYVFNFILTEVLYGANVITFNVREMGGDTSKKDNYVTR